MLVISTGVTQRVLAPPDLQSADEVDASLRRRTSGSRRAASIAVIGGGAAAVSSALNVADDLAGQAGRPLLPGRPGAPAAPPAGSGAYVAGAARRRSASGCTRATAPSCRTGSTATRSPTSPSPGAPASRREAPTPCSGRSAGSGPTPPGCPPSCSTSDGFVGRRADLRVAGHPGVFAIGDVAATDPLRTSARNRADQLLARNIRADLEGRPLRDYRPRAAVGLGRRRPAERPRGVRAQRPGVPVPGLVDPRLLQGLDRAARHLPRRARLLTPR